MLIPVAINSKGNKLLFFLIYKIHKLLKKNEDQIEKCLIRLLNSHFIEYLYTNFFCVIDVKLSGAMKRFVRFLGLFCINVLAFQAVAQEKTDSIMLHDAVNLLSQYVKCSSETGNEQNAAVFLSQKCADAGLIVQFITKEPASYNFIASIFPLEKRKPNIVFLNHMDVVPAGNEKNWNYPPYSGTISGNKVWGRGAFDNKGLAIIQLFSILKFMGMKDQHDLPFNVSVLCVSGEETGGVNGSAKVAEQLELINPLVIIGEGGSGLENVGFEPDGKILFGISIAEKGMLWLKISADVERNGHASVVGSDYANLRLINALHRVLNWEQPIRMSSETKLMFKSIGELVGGGKGFALKHLNNPVFRPALKNYFEKNHELEAVFKNAVSITNFGVTEHNPNINAQVAEASLDCRLLPDEDPVEFVKDLKKVINDSLIKIEILNKYNNQYSTKPDQYFDYLDAAIKNNFKAAEVVPMLFPASCDNSYYRKSGCPVYGLNPLIVSQDQLQAIHNSNEYIDFDDIAKGINVFCDFIELIMYAPNHAN
jgi:carboxypeptidase PM20D1